MTRFSALLVLMPHVARFLWRVLAAFLRNRGLLLAGGVGYNILLSIVPLFALLTVLLTQVFNEALLLEVIGVQVQHLAPTHAEVLLDAVRALLDSRDMIGLFGIVVLLVFSSFVFRMLEDALAIIFHAPEVPQKRSLWVSVLLPYLFMLVLGAGLLALPCWRAWPRPSMRCGWLSSGATCLSPVSPTRCSTCSASSACSCSSAPSTRCCRWSTSHSGGRWWAGS